MHKRFLIMILAVTLLFMFSIAVNAAEFKTPAQLVTEAKASVKEVSVQDLKNMIKNNENIVILDIRDKDEYEKQHIPGAIHMSRGLVDLHLNEIIPDKNTKIVLYWIFDKRSPLAVKSLNEIGYVNAVNLDGGMKAWMDDGNPLHKNKTGYSIADRY